MPLFAVLAKFREQGMQGCLYVSHKAIIKLCASAQLLSQSINLDDGCVFRKELLVRKICTEHEQHVTVHHCMIARRKSYQSGHTHIKWIVIFDEFFPSHGVYDRSIQLACQLN